MWWSNKVSYINCQNSATEFDGGIMAGQVTHCLLSLAVKGVESENAQDQCQYYHDIDFIDNVQRILRLMRLLSFTTAAYDKRSIEEQ